MPEWLQVVLIVLWVMLGPMGLIFVLTEVMRPRGDDFSYEAKRDEGVLAHFVISAVVTIAGGLWLYFRA